MDSRYVVKYQDQFLEYHTCFCGTEKGLFEAVRSITENPQYILCDIKRENLEK